MIFYDPKMTYLTPFDADAGDFHYSSHRRWAMISSCHVKGTRVGYCAKTHTKPLFCAPFLCASTYYLKSTYYAAKRIEANQNELGPRRGALLALWYQNTVTKAVIKE